MLCMLSTKVMGKEVKDVLTKLRRGDSGVTDPRIRRPESPYKLSVA